MDYSFEILTAYKITKLRGELFWHTFIMTFKPHKILSWTYASKFEWFDLLAEREVLVRNDGQLTMKKCIVY